MKKILALLLVVILTATISISGTLAFVQTANAAPVDVETEGSVKIDQQIYYRTIITDDNTQACTLEERKPCELEGKTINASFPLYPAIYAGDTPDKKVFSSTNNITGMNMYIAPNAQDEIVVVANTGIQSAYVRTWFAIECGDMGQDELKEVITLNTNTSDWSWDDNWNDGKSVIQEIDGKDYYVVLATYNNMLDAGATTPPSLLQIMLSKDAGNEDCIKLTAGDSKDFALDIIIFSQAAEPLDGCTAQQTLNTVFKTNSPWTQAEPTT